MIKQLTYLIFIFSLSQVHAQENRTVTTGKIISDALNIENIHVFNKNSNKGTISNQYGEFVITVKTNDTLVFSGIQFYKKEIHITKELIKNKLITIELFQKINELDEVEVKAHNLSGSLTIDANNLKDSVSKVSIGALDFSMIDFGKPVVDDIDDFDRKKPPNPNNLTNPNIPVGGNVLGLLKFALDPLMGEISKIGQRKRQLKKEKRIHIIKKQEAPNQIIDDLSETFFTETLKIPREEIDDFIQHCKSKGIIDLYIKNRKMEVIDILIVESEIYLRKSKE